MKQNLLRFILLILSFFNLAVSLQAQTINVVSNPTAPDIFTNLGSGGALSGYAGTPVLFNNKLVLQYNNTSQNQNVSNGTDYQTTIQLAVYDGTSIHLISNP